MAITSEEQRKARKVIADGVRVMVLNWSLLEPRVIGHVAASRLGFDDWGNRTIPVYDIQFPWGIHEGITYDRVLEIPTPTTEKE